MTDVFRRGMWHLVLVAMLTRPAATARAGRCQGLADVQPRPRRLAVQPGRDGDRPGQRRPARGEMAVPGQGLGASRSASSMPRPSSWTATSTSARRPTPTFYKLTPDGKLRWSYRNPARSGGRPASGPAGADGPSHDFRFQSVARGDLGLGAGDRRHRLLRRHRRLVLRPRPRDRRRALEAQRAGRASSPAPTPINVFFASPILADGKLIVGGGTLEQLIAGGLVLSRLDRAGASSWRSSRRPAGSPGSTTSAPSPSRSTRRSRSRIAGATHFFYFGPATSTSGARPPTTPSPARSSSAPTSTPPRGGRRRTTPGCTRASRARSSRWTCTPASERWVTQINPGDVWTNAMRAYDPKDGPAQGPVDRRHAQDLHDPGRRQADQGGRRGLQERRLLRPAGRRTARSLDHTPIYTGPPTYPLSPDAGPPDARPAELHRRPADRLRHRRQDDLHQRHRRHPARLAGEAGGQRRRRRRAAAWWPSASTRRPSAGGTSGPRSPRSAARRRSRCTPTSATRSPRGSPWPTASSTSPTVASGKLVALDAATGLGPQGDRPRPGLVGPLGLARPRLRRHGQHAVHPGRLRGVLPQEVHRRSSTPSACPARTKSADWAREGVRRDRTHP